MAKPDHAQQEPSVREVEEVVLFQFSAELQADARSEDARMVDGLCPADQAHFGTVAPGRFT